MVQKENKVSALEARKELWRRGELSWKLDKNQKELYKLFHESEHKVQTWLLARRSGKTFALCVLALELCVKRPNSIVKFLSPTRLQVQNNIRPLIRQILEDCPEDLRPSDMKTQDFIYYFPNGSELQLAGSEAGHAEKLRGGSSHISIIDEAQDVSNLDDIIKSVLLPTTLTTGGKVLVAGTPPKSTDHEFVKLIERAEERGSIVKKTVYDNPRILEKDLEVILEEHAPLRERDPKFRREYLCEIIQDQDTAVIPEFTEQLKAEIVKDWTRPPFFDGYVSMDLGAVDLTALLFGYYDFRAGKLIIEDELVCDFSKKDMNIEVLVKRIQEKENALWTNPLSGEVKKPYMRVSDINPIVTQEIAVKSFGQVFFSPTKKDDKEAAINNMRALLGGQKIIIHPRCEHLLRHLKHVKWASAKNKNTFSRSQDNGHYDLVDCLIYMCRAVLYSKNPYPVGYDMGNQDYFVPNPQAFYSKSTVKATENYKRIFGIKGKR